MNHGNVSISLVTKLYTELADWWPTLSGPDEYEDEAAFFIRLLKESSDPPPRTVLDLGSGGGIDVLAVLPLGYPKRKPAGQKKRKPFDQVVSDEFFGKHMSAR